jgi:hypothetical protein
VNKVLILMVAGVLASCVAPGPPTIPNDKEWSLLTADYTWLETLRKAQKVPAPSAPRKQQIELLLENHRRVEPVYIAFMDKLREYYQRTSDPRAASLMVKEKIAIGDEYMNILSRYDRALDHYRSALQIDPSSAEAKQRVALAEERRYVSMNAFTAIRRGMNEEEVRRLVGLPREDWIKQVVQNSRIYAVWIYPKSDGGASAVYFDNGVVYHTNWNAAASQQPQDGKTN